MDKIITIYYGSKQVVEVPAFGLGRKNNGFGLGFYSTESEAPAKNVPPLLCVMALQIVTQSNILAWEIPLPDPSEFVCNQICNTIKIQSSQYYWINNMK